MCGVLAKEDWGDDEEVWIFNDTFGTINIFRNHYKVTFMTILLTRFLFNNNGSGHI